MQRNIGDHLDIITRNKNVVFKKGLIHAKIKGSDILVNNMIFTGPQMKSRIEKQGRINLLHDEVELETITEFAGVMYPLSISGELSSPSVNYANFILRFIPQNTKNTALDIIEAVSLGLTGGDGDEWKIDDPFAKDKNKKKE